MIVHKRVFLIANEEYLLNHSGGGNDIKSDINALRRLFSEVFLISLMRNKINENLQRINKESDYLYFSGFLSFERFFSQVDSRKYRNNIRITNIKDLHFLRELRFEMLTNENSGNHNHIMSRELAVYKHSNLVLSFSEDEIRLINKIDSKVNIKKHYYYNPDFSPSNFFLFNGKMIFIGNFEHLPNLDGILNFDKNFSFNPDEFQFEIYGQHAQKKLNGLKLRNNYKIIGEINNSLECYSQGGLFISPMRFGGGIKIKIIEAALRNIPIIASAESIEGLNLKPNVSYIPLDTNLNFQDTLSEFRSRNLRIKHIANAGRSAIEEISNESIVINNLSSLINSIELN